MSTTYTHERQFSRVDDRGLLPFPTRCPSWCAIGNGTGRESFHRDYEPTATLPQSRVHEGPTFGAVTITARESMDAPGILCISADVNAVDADLRQVTADALAAADWIGAQS